MFICNFSMLCVAQGEDFLPFDFSLKRNQPRSVGVRGRKTRLFAKQKCRALLVYKQSYGCFEMVRFSRKPLNKETITKFCLFLQPKINSPLTTLNISKRNKVCKARRHRRQSRACMRRGGSRLCGRLGRLCHGARPGSSAKFC